MPGAQTTATFTPTPQAHQLSRILPTLTAAGKSVTFFDPNFQQPQIRQADLTVERDLGWGHRPFGQLSGQLRPSTAQLC